MSTDGSGYAYIEHSLGKTPAAFVVCASTTGNDTIDKIAKVSAVSADAANIRIRVSRTDSNAWLTGNPVDVRWIAFSN